ncbi:hypothetical protein CRE_17684 [Caenorhabditis remanei]|uniref:Serpentine Receptor, class U n=1 Tax=Caenorhabditis remanei TaxID=31234 RepID=E3NQD4_CAERE|nr:hypothetical protein CRE_17684 [Caenorhabditis remanei]
MAEHAFNTYIPINSIPEYQNFSYNFDYVTIIMLFNFICLFPTLFATTKTVLHYSKHANQNSQGGIHPYVFKSFVYMQISSLVYTVFDYIIDRIPSTSVVTSYFSTMKSDSPVKYAVAAYYLFEYLYQLLTVLFCLMRLLVFIDLKNQLKITCLTFHFWPIISTIICVIASIPHCLYGAVAIQLDVPFQYGAIVFTTTLNFTSRTQTLGKFFFSVVLSILIIMMTFMMLLKLNNLKRLSSISNRNLKAETTLTITMFLILIPTVLNQIITVSSMFAPMYASYSILLRLTLMDCRVNIVSWYFYWTHPYFKKKTTVTNSLNIKVTIIT